MIGEETNSSPPVQDASLREGVEDIDPPNAPARPTSPIPPPAPTSRPVSPTIQITTSSSTITTNDGINTAEQQQQQPSLLSLASVPAASGSSGSSPKQSPRTRVGSRGPRPDPPPSRPVPAKGTILNGSSSTGDKERKKSSSGRKGGLSEVLHEPKWDSKVFFPLVEDDFEPGVVRGSDYVRTIYVEQDQALKILRDATGIEAKVNPGDTVGGMSSSDGPFECTALAELLRGELGMLYSGLQVEIDMVVTLTQQWHSVGGHDGGVVGRKRGKSRDRGHGGDDSAGNGVGRSVAKTGRLKVMFQVDLADDRTAMADSLARWFVLNALLIVPLLILLAFVMPGTPAVVIGAVLFAAMYSPDWPLLLRYPYYIRQRTDASWLPGRRKPKWSDMVWLWKSIIDDGPREFFQEALPERVKRGVFEVNNKSLTTVKEARNGAHRLILHRASGVRIAVNDYEPRGDDEIVDWNPFRRVGPQWCRVKGGTAAVPLLEYNTGNRRYRSSSRRVADIDGADRTPFAEDIMTRSSSLDLSLSIRRAVLIGLYVGVCIGGFWWVTRGSNWVTTLVKFAIDG